MRRIDKTRRDIMPDKQQNPGKELEYFNHLLSFDENIWHYEICV